MQLLSRSIRSAIHVQNRVKGKRLKMNTNGGNNREASRYDMHGYQRKVGNEMKPKNYSGASDSSIKISV